MNDAGIVAVSCWLLTKLVGTGEVFQTTVADEVKFAPLTVRVKSRPPAMIFAGDNEAKTAAGLLGGGGGLALLPPPQPASAITVPVSTKAATIVFRFVACMIAPLLFRVFPFWRG